MEYYKKVDFQRRLKSLRIYCTIFLFLIFITGCNKKDNADSAVIEEQNTMTIYYVDNGETKLVPIEYEVENDKKEDIVKELLRKLNEDSSKNNYKAVKSDLMKMERYVFEEDKRLSVYFSTDYYKIDHITEVLYRASITKTLTQVEEIDYVEFYVGGLPLSFNDKFVGRMRSEDFIMGTELENIIITVYFSNDDGTALIDSSLRIPSVSDLSMEQLVINRLIQGPIQEQLDGGLKQTIPRDTELIKVTTKDGICYIDFSEEFLNKMTGINDEVVIYSIVNSLVEIQSINKVQFTIEGESKKMYRDKIPFNGFFERNLEIVEGTK